MNYQKRKFERYYLEGKYRGKNKNGLWFKGDDNEINLQTSHPEFKEWKWTEIENLPKIIVDFKKDVYKKLLKN